jgi:hypothetical protein
MSLKHSNPTKEKSPVLASSCILKSNGMKNINNINIMNSKQLAQYMEATNSISKPWLLVQLRLKKLQERKATMSENEFDTELQDIHQDLMNLGEWWRGIEDEVF